MLSTNEEKMTRILMAIHQESTKTLGVESVRVLGQVDCSNFLKRKKHDYNFIKR